MTKEYFDFGETASRDRYKLLAGLIVPRPIGWIGTRRRNGSFNLAPFSFFNVVSTSPPTVLFSGSSHSDRPKDSVSLAEESGEFTVNIVSEDVAPAMSVTAGSFGPEDDEFEIAGLTPVAGTVVDAPMVAESPANLECRVTNILDIDEGVTRIVVGRVVALHVDYSVLDGTRIDARQLRAVGRMSGNTYVTTHHFFELQRSLLPLAGVPAYASLPPPGGWGEYGDVGAGRGAGAHQRCWRRVRTQLDALKPPYLPALGGRAGTFPPFGSASGGTAARFARWGNSYRLQLNWRRVG